MKKNLRFQRLAWLALALSVFHCTGGSGSGTTTGGGCAGGGALDPPGDGSFRLDLNRLTIRPGHMQLDFNVQKIAIFYDNPPDAAQKDNHCTAPGGTFLHITPGGIVNADLTKTGITPIGTFFAQPGHVTEIRLYVDNIQLTRSKDQVPAKTDLRCEEQGPSRKLDILRLLPAPGESVDLIADQNTEVAADFDPKTDIHPEYRDGKNNNESSNMPTVANEHALKVITASGQSGVLLDRIVIVFNPGVTRSAINTINAGVGTTVIDFDQRTNYYVLKLPTNANYTDIANYYSQKSEVHFALPDTLIFDDVVPCDPGFQPAAAQAPYNQINAPSAWDITTGLDASGKRRALMAVIDNGFDLANPDMVFNYFINQGELVSKPGVSGSGVKFFDANNDGTVTAAEVASFDTDGDGLISFVDLNKPALKCLCNGPPLQATCPTLSCDKDGDGVVTPLDLVNGVCPNGNCAAGFGFQDGQDNDNNGRIDDIVGWDFQNQDNQPQALQMMSAGCSASHGIGVAGIVAAAGAAPPTMGMCASKLSVGMNWSGWLVPIQKGPVPSSGVTPDVALMQSSRSQGYLGLAYAASLGVDVLNASWSVYYTKGAPKQVAQHIPNLGDKYDTLVLALRAEGKNLGLGKTLIVTTAGNSAENTDDPDVFHWPSELSVVDPNIITVANITTGGTTLSSTSGFGPTTVNIAAPGTGITMLQDTSSGGGLISCSGTSFAAPFVTGTVGLMLAADQSMIGDPAKIKARLYCNSAILASIANQVEQGRLLDANASVRNSKGCP